MSIPLSVQQPLHALIVDDDFDSLLLLSTLLEMYGVKVTSANCVAEAIEAFESSPDILISDLAMPHRDGYELIRQIRQLPPDQGGKVPAIALSAWVAIESQTCAIESGFHAFLEKPYQPADLVETISRLTGCELIDAELAA